MYGGLITNVSDLYLAPPHRVIMKTVVRLNTYLVICNLDFNKTIKRDKSSILFGFNSYMEHMKPY